MTLIEIAESTGQQKSATFKQLARLVQVDLVRKDSAGAYTVGMKFQSLAQQALLSHGDQGLSRGILRDLREASGETATIVGIDEGEARIFQREESRNVVAINMREGDHFELADSASALVLLAYGHSLVERESLREKSANIPSEEELQSVVEAGYAVSIDKLVDGISAVAVPYKMPMDSKQYALTLLVPSFRFDLDAVIALLIEYACY